MKSMKLVGIIATALICSTGTLYAAEGGYSGGGGDTLVEQHFDEIRIDMLNWVNRGGARDLNLPPSISYEKYESEMRRILSSHEVIISAVTPEEEEKAAKNGVAELQVKVEGAPKTCRGFRSSSDGRAHILCSTTRFLATQIDDLYILIHHEFAGLAGLEQNIGASSDYQISGQLSGFLEFEFVKKLSIHKKKNDVTNSPLKISPELIGTWVIQNLECFGPRKNKRDLAKMKNDSHYQITFTIAGDRGVVTESDLSCTMMDHGAIIQNKNKIEFVPDDDRVMGGLEDTINGEGRCQRQMNNYLNLTLVKNKLKTRVFKTFSGLDGFNTYEKCDEMIITFVRI